MKQKQLLQHMCDKFAKQAKRLRCEFKEDPQQFCDNYSVDMDLRPCGDFAALSNIIIIELFNNYHSYFECDEDITDFGMIVTDMLLN